MKRFLLLIFLPSLLFAQDSFYRSNISAEKLNANQSYTVKASRDSIPPASGFAKIWMKDTNYIYLIMPSGRRVNLKDAGSGTGGAGTGTVTVVSSANSDISVALGTTTPVLTLNTGTLGNQIVKLNSNGQLPVVSGVNLTGIITTNVTEGTNLYYTDARARASISGSGFISYNATTGVLSVAGQSITNGYILDGTLTDGKIASGQVVKSLNGLHDFVKLAGEGGASVRASNDTIYINAGSGGGAGDTIRAIQSTGTISVTNPNGPTVTIDVATNGIDSNKIKTGNVTSTDIKDGDINTIDFSATAKAPLATLADSAVPRGSAAGDLTGTYPSPTIGSQKITASKILNNTITRTQVTTSFKAPYADTADFATFTSLRTDTVTLPAGQDSVDVTIAGLVNISWASAEYAELSDYVVPAGSPTVRTRANKLTIKTWQTYPVSTRINYSYKLTTR